MWSLSPEEGARRLLAGFGFTGQSSTFTGHAHWIVYWRWRSAPGLELVVSSKPLGAAVSRPARLPRCTAGFRHYSLVKQSARACTLTWAYTHRHRHCVGACCNHTEQPAKEFKRTPGREQCLCACMCKSLHCIGRGPRYSLFSSLARHANARGPFLASGSCHLELMCMCP